MAVLHKYFLTMFDMSIGELWDFDAFSGACKRTEKYSFLLASAPLNHLSLVTSSPNATGRTCWRVKKGMTRAVCNSQVPTMVSADNIKACPINFDQT